jgi:hypothetical protein
VSSRAGYRIEIMSARAAFHSISVQLVLFAATFQGVTPDPNDLASIRGLKFLCQFSDYPDPMTDEDGSANHECSSIQPKINAFLRRQREDAPNPLPAAIDPRFQLVHARVVGDPSHRGKRTPSGVLSHSPSRLNC